jgi:hypothetical protein
VVVKTDNHANKMVWANAFEAQIDVLSNKIVSAARAITAEEEALSLSPGSLDGGSVLIPSVALKNAEIYNSTGNNNTESHPLTSSFSSVKTSASGTIGSPRPAEISIPVEVSSPEDHEVSSPRDTALTPQLVEFLAEENDEEEEEEWRVEEDDEDEEEEYEIEDDDVIPATTNGDANKKGGDSPKTNGSKPYKPKNYKFGLQPETIVSVQDFGVAPELLTTAQKVAILESAAFQNKATAVQPKRIQVQRQQSLNPNLAPAAFTASRPASGTSSVPADYVASGLRLSDIDKTHTEIENDGGSVANTKDTLRSKISKWEGWVKEKAPVPVVRQASVQFPNK